SVVGILAVYGGVAGAEPPVVRAVVAAVLAAVAARIGRPFGLASGLLAPALVTAAASPEQLTGPSFLLSYAAVIGLGVAARTPSAPGLFGALRSALRASFWATLLTTPLTLWFFEQLAPTTILLTPLCAPIVAALLLLGLVAASLAAVAPLLAEWLGPLLQLLAATYASIVYAADSLPWTPISSNGTPPGWLVGLAGFTAAGWIFARPRRRTIIGGAALVAALWFLPLAPAAAPGLEVFAVGHGQAALLTDSSGAQSLVDCGSLQSGARAAASVTAALPRRRLELLVITHDDADHHNGVAALLRRVRVARAILPASMKATAVHQLLRAHATSVELLPNGATRREGPLRVSAPRVPATASDNNRSLWVRASLRGAEVLLSGDAQEDGVAAAIKDGIAGQADLLLLPHHGRSNGNAPLLLAAVQPRACLVSAAANDGATALGVLARRFGAEVWTTGRHGDLRFDGAAVHAAQTAVVVAPAGRPR
ncbi:MAG: ComEC/Rec2 family competence protein, partial [Planctomycetota bacterium]|nr:ComEC/Rec2 family competence protein [Planctomycetota bacterium]